MRKTAEKKRQRTGFNINAWLSPDLGQAFESLRKKTKMTKRMQLEDILERALAKAGLWSPSEAGR